jgi:hypothetical protein
LNTQKFGDIYSVTYKEEAIISHFLFTQYPILKENSVQYKIGKLPDQEYMDISVHLPS